MFATRCHGRAPRLPRPPSRRADGASRAAPTCCARTRTARVAVNSSGLRLAATAQRRLLSRRPYSYYGREPVGRRLTGLGPFISPRCSWVAMPVSSRRGEDGAVRRPAGSPRDRLALAEAGSDGSGRTGARDGLDRRGYPRARRRACIGGDLSYRAAVWRWPTRRSARRWRSTSSSQRGTIRARRRGASRRMGAAAHALDAVFCCRRAGRG